MREGRPFGPATRRAGALACAAAAVTTLLYACPAAALPSGGPQAAAPPAAPQPPKASLRAPHASPKICIDPAARVMLQQMLNAEKNLALAGRQTTVLYQPAGALTAKQTIARRGDHAFRLEFQSPAALNGQVIVDNGQVEWHYFPKRKTLEVVPSRMEMLSGRIAPVMHELGKGNLSAQVVGSDTVAGHATQVVQVNSAGRWGIAQRYWIDPTNGAQLRIETYDRDGHLVSASYFTQVSYNPPLGKDTFAPPKIPHDAQIVSPPVGQTLLRPPADGEAGFHVLQPASLPPGYQFQSASLGRFQGKPLVGLQYGDGVNILSLYQSPLRHPQTDQILRPRDGVLIARQKGMHFVLIGNLPDDQMMRVMQSLR